MILRFSTTDQNGNPEIYDLISASNTAPYQLEKNSWAPANADVPFSGTRTTPYAPVRETFRIAIFGTTPSECLQSYEQLVHLVHIRAPLYHQGMGISPVYLQVSVAGDPAYPLQAMLVPAPDGGPVGVVGPPTTLVSDLHGSYIRDITISVWRQGFWYGAGSNGAPSTTTMPLVNGGVAYIAGAASFLGTGLRVEPTSALLIAGQTLTTQATYGPWLLACAPTQLSTLGAHDGIIHIAATAAATKTGTAWTLDAYASATSGFAWRYTPTSTSEVSITYPFPMTPVARRAIVFVKCLVDVGTTDTYFTCQLLGHAGGYPYRGRPQTIGKTATSGTQLVCLGELSLVEPWQRVGMLITPSASGAGINLYVESFFVVFLDRQPTFVAVIPVMTQLQIAHIIGQTPMIHVPTPDIPEMDLLAGTPLRVPVIRGGANSFRPIVYGDRSVWVRPGIHALLFTGVCGQSFAPFGPTKANMTVQTTSRRGALTVA